MKKVFLSAYGIGTDVKVDEFHSLLLGKGYEITTSPKAGGSESNDPKWDDWYNKGFINVISECDIFVCFINQAWDSSTWMMFEADTALNIYNKKGSKLKQYLFFNPSNYQVTSRGMVQYLKTELYQDLSNLG